MEGARKIRLFKPCVGEEEIEKIREVFKRAWLGLGPMVEEFERQWSSYIGRTHSIGVNSCTAALHLALLVPEFPEGKKVLVPAITFVSTAHAALYNRLEPVFVDVDEETLVMDPEDLERKITPDCVAVIPVHLGGQPAPMDRIVSLARRHHLLVVEDCANSAGGKYQGRTLGTWGDLGCFSFEEKKNMTSGDGGMICCDDEEVSQKLKKYRWVGIDRDTWRRLKTTVNDLDDPLHWYYEISVLGFKYNMNDLMAAIGLAQLQKLDSMNQRRAKIIERYLAGISECRKIRPAFPYSLKDSAYWLFMIRTPDRDRLILHLKRNGISTGVHFMPIPLHPLYRSYDRGIEVAKRVWNEFITLPLFPELEEKDVDYIIEKLIEFDRA